MQLVWFASSWYVPGGQRRAACPAPSSAYAPGTDTQAARLAEPADDCVSAGQASHASAATLYLPASQSRHVVATDTPIVVEYLPAAQSRHVVATDAPTVVEYLPAPQSVHEAATEAPRVAEYLPASQLMHVSVAEAPNVVEYLPTPQSRHMESPVMILYFPAVHAAHDAAFSREPSVAKTAARENTSTGR